MNFLKKPIPTVEGERLCMQSYEVLPFLSMLFCRLGQRLGVRRWVGVSCRGKKVSLNSSREFTAQCPNRSFGGPAFADSSPKDVPGSRQPVFPKFAESWGAPNDQGNNRKGKDLHGRESTMRSQHIRDFLILANAMYLSFPKVPLATFHQLFLMIEEECPQLLHEKETQLQTLLRHIKPRCRRKF